MFVLTKPHQTRTSASTRDPKHLLSGESVQVALVTDETVAHVGFT